MNKRMDLTLEQKADFIHDLIGDVRPADRHFYAVSVSTTHEVIDAVRFIRVQDTPENAALMVKGNPVPDYLYEEFVYLFEDTEQPDKVMAVFTGLSKLPVTKDVMGYAYGATDAEALAQHIVDYLITGKHPHEG